MFQETFFNENKPMSFRVSNKRVVLALPPKDFSTNEQEEQGSFESPLSPFTRGKYEHV